MHKTLYIDIDEEITSIIDRVKKTQAREIILIAPKNALILQGIVNLRLLKKEADRQKKQLLIVTQDKFGKKLIEKAGILAQTKADNDIFLEESETEEDDYEPMYKNEAEAIKEELEKDGEVGTSSFFAAGSGSAAAENMAASEASQKIVHTKTAKREIEKIAKYEMENELEPESEKPSVRMSDIVAGKKAATKRKKTKEKPPEKKPEPEPDIVIRETDTVSESYVESNVAPPKISQVSIKKADQFFKKNRKEERILETEKVGGGAKKFFLFFGLIVVFLAAVALASYFLPKATVYIQLKSDKKPVSLDVDAENSGSQPIKAEYDEITTDFGEEFDSTGAVKGGTKAGGKVVIYNEYSSDSQPLVATTRLETTDGKIFRITKNVVVPGFSKVDGEVKPGAIEVEVVADQAGDSYNIDPAEFKIVGFKGSSKYEKFYAKSTEAMAGGSEGDGKMVTAQDIASAREKLATDAKEKAAELAKENLPSGRKVFDNAIKTDVSGITVSEDIGAEKDKLTASAKVKLSVLSVDEAEIKNLMRDDLVKSGVNSSDILFNQPVDYILSEANFENKSLEFQAKTTATIGSGFDAENFRKGILGKTSSDAQNYSKNFDAIEKIDIDFWPFFVKRMPMNEKRIDIEEKTID
ncbi:MAG: hypothetical protein PHF35_02055 [Candidatus Moranbacteria bacterium]|nr:hypothetical protein [Candidatus Moranbacteria bacterium]